jgi:four helix bundle protein
MDEQHARVWEHRQAELWDRIFQVTQDVVTLADSMEDDAGGAVVKAEMVKAAMEVGRHLVRANAADRPRDFDEQLNESKLKAIETDYWLRMGYVLQQREDVQRDLSSIITQYSSIIDMLHKFIRHARTEKDVIQKHTRGPLVS